MPYDKGRWTLLVEAGEGHVDLVTNSLADGTIDATEARSILTSAVALSALIAMAAGVVRACQWALYAWRTPRDYCREHPGWEWDAARDLPPAA
jgi:hypothetical protein